MMLTPPLLVERINLRELSGSSDATMPAAFSSGTDCSNMRPFERAILMLIFFCQALLSMCPLDARAELTKFFFYAFIPAIEMVNPVYKSFSFCNQARQYQTC